MIRRIAFALSLGLGLALGTLWLLGSQNGVALADPGILYVAPGGDCGGATPCHANVQDAVDAASPGDEIRVAAGTYTGVSARAGITQTVYISKTVTIRGGYTTSEWDTPGPAANPTTLDAQGQGRVLYIIGDITPTVEGLRITGGDAGGLGGYYGYDAGGGVYVNNAAALISDNLVYSNTSHLGGGMFLDNSPAILDSNTVSSNTTTYGGAGGGLYLYHSAATLRGNIISGNTATRSGGGLFLLDSDVTLTNNVVADNQATTAGSGLYIYGSSPCLLHTTIARNGGGDGSGVYITDLGSDYSTVTMTNTTIVSHTVGVMVTAGNTATLNATLWHANTTPWSGNVNRAYDRSGDPAFAADGYHLTSSSAAIDTGVDAGVTTDIDGDARPQGTAPDLGADEYPSGVTLTYEIYLPLVLKKHP